MQMIGRYLRSERGQSVVEYTLLLVCIVLAGLGALQAFGISVKDLWEYCGGRISQCLG